MAASNALDMLIPLGLIKRIVQRCLSKIGSMRLSAGRFFATLLLKSAILDAGYGFVYRGHRDIIRLRYDGVVECAEYVVAGYGKFTGDAFRRPE